MDKEFKNVEYWIFDLDETLYRPETDIAEQVSDKIAEFLMMEYGWSKDLASKIQKEYYYEYGSTVQGLIKTGKLDDAQKFETFVHDVDFSHLESNKALDKALGKLKGKKYVLTTSQGPYAEKILDAIGILGHFEVVWGLEETDYIAKPSPHPYNKMIVEEEIDIERAAMFEDSYKNIVGAKNLGLKTIWIDNGGGHQSNSGDVKEVDMSFVDIHTKDIVKTIEELAELQE
jgi:putative hydrolase of the HAD superfamily